MYSSIAKKSMGFYLINSFFFRYYIQWGEISRHVFSIYKNWNSLIFSMCVCVCVCVCVCSLLSIIFTTNGSILRSSSHIVWRDILPYSRPSILLDCTSRKTARLVSLPGNRSSHTVSVTLLSLFLIQMVVYQIPVTPRIRRQWRAEILPGHEEQSAISNTLLFKVFLNKTTEWLFLSHKKNTAGERELAVNISIWNQPIPIELVCVGGDWQWR